MLFVNAWCVMQVLFFTILILFYFRCYQVQYDFNTRRIYPLFLELGLAFNTPDRALFMKNLKLVVRANYMYCLRGDDSLYRELLGPEKCARALAPGGVLKEFKEKFMPFFVEVNTHSNTRTQPTRL